MRDIINTKILLSASTLVVALAIVIGATYAFFSDNETSADNTFVAGAVDLKIGNESYYNGSVCTNVGTPEEPEYEWVGVDGVYPDGLPCSSTWVINDLEEGSLFFDFDDIKPGDIGEDTIAIRVDTNDAWACMDMEVTEDEGLLGGLLNFVFWNDDGDNVFEVGEEILVEGPASTVLNSSIVLADSQENNVGGTDGDPLEGEEEYHIAKAWCFGTLAQVPVPAGQGENPTVASGFTCNGENLDNLSQGHSLSVDINFNAVQSRHNPDFVCSDDEPTDPLLWIIGDEESDQLDSPVDELNFVAFGNFPNPPAIGAPYTRVITSPLDDVADEEFPWNSNFNSNYGRTINVDFSYAGSDIPVILTFGWSPGRSANEQKEVYLDDVLIYTTPVRTGVSTPGWWENMERCVETDTFTLIEGNHTLRFEHLFGDGTIWDFIKLEKQ